MSTPASCLRAAIVTIGTLACSRAEPPLPAAPPVPGPSAGSDAAAHASGEGAELVGMRPPEWEAESWTNAAPLTLASLRGSVILARWWTAGCAYCETTAPALRDFHRRLGPRGLVVIGFYHHKGEGPVDVDHMRATAARYGFTFPIAIDPEWRTLDRWWMSREKRRTFTSVTFVLDRRGVVRLVHPGGQYVRGDAAFEQIDQTLEALLAESAGDAGSP